MAESLESLVVKPKVFKKLKQLAKAKPDELPEYDYLVRREGSMFGGHFERTIYKIDNVIGGVVVLDRNGRKEYIVPSFEWFLAKEEDLTEEYLEEPPAWFKRK